MSNVQTDLQALLKIQEDFQRIKKLDQEIQNVKDEIDSQNAYYAGERYPTPPIKNNAKSKAMKQQANGSPAGTYALLFTVCMIVVAVVALFIGLKHGALLAILAAGIAWIGSTMGIFGAVAGIGLGTWIGWKCWSQANTAQVVILVLMAIGTIIFSYLYKKANDAEGDIHGDIKRQEELEEQEYKKALAEHEKTVEKIKKRNAEAKKARNKAFYDEIDGLKAQQRQIHDEIMKNPVLDNSDKTEEVIVFLVSQIQRKRANSLSEALQQYDAKVEQERRAEIEQLDRKLQADLDRFNRDQQIRREADEQFNQAMHRMRMEKEQRRQTEELERIRKELER